MPQSLPPFVPHHVGLTVPSVEKAAQWYADVLGFAVQTRTSNPENGLQIAMLQKDGFCIELFQMPSGGRLEPVYDDIAAHLPYEGWRHLAFQVDDLEATMAELKERGATHAGGPIENPTLGFTYAFVVDPFGNLVEFLQRNSPIGTD